MTVSPNLQLTIWDSPNDEFNTQELADNFEKIDADALRARPTDRAEILATLPGTGNFDGRLVFLTTANGGFPAMSLVRYAGSSWKVVGPFEVLSAVPSSGNFAGRLVLLSAANGGFSAWSLIKYDGSSWSAIGGTQIDVVSAIPSSGNYPGRIIVLNTATSGFSAWDVVRYNGTAWHLIGPHHAMATSVTNLGTTEGRMVTLRAGSSPYEIVNLAYDNTIQHYVSPVVQNATSPNFSMPDTTVLFTAETGTIQPPRLVVPNLLSIFNAGLRPQVTFSAVVTAPSNDTVHLRVNMLNANAGESYTSVGTSNSISGTGAAGLLFSTWQNHPSFVPNKQHAMFQLEVMINAIPPAESNIFIRNATLSLRWISA